ncbi:MAG: pullulanase [Bacilli bacterium]|nr:pullulanase [Bacilli bacterium]
MKLNRKEDDMLTINEFSVEIIKDPFGILTGERYEFVLGIEVPEDDDLYSENGLYLKVVYLVDEGRSEIIKYEFFENKTEQYLDLEMEDDEKEVVTAFCKDHYLEAIQ